MFSKLSPALVAFGGSLLLLAGLIGVLYWTNDTGQATPNGPLLVYCAEAMRPPMEAIAKEYEKDYGQKIEVRFGASQTILFNLSLTQQGDLFLPADDSYIALAKQKGFVKDGDVFNLARMHAVVIVSPKVTAEIATWSDFLDPKYKIALGNPDSTAIGKVVKEKLQAEGHWKALADRMPNYQGKVTEVLNSVQLGSVDVGIVWDAVALPHPKVKIVRLKELENAEARVQVAITKFSTQRDSAHQFIRYLRAADKGAIYLKKQGYSDIEERGPMDERPELVVYAGAMLQPALKEALIEFKKRENVQIVTVYNGCGILVSQMKTGETPDLYFACDTTFMDQVKDRFAAPICVSNNQLVIAVKKGNPKQVFNLLDLAKPGLRVGIGHEQNCALGALTKETFVRTGVYAKVMVNVKVQSPTGDNLINQLRPGSLDVVIAYRTNVAPFPDLEYIPIEGVKCATPSQPIAVSKSTTHPELSKRLVEFLSQKESRERFEKSGFGWELKEVGN